MIADSVNPKRTPHCLSHLSASHNGVFSYFRDGISTLLTFYEISCEIANHMLLIVHISKKKYEKHARNKDNSFEI